MSSPLQSLDNLTSAAKDFLQKVITPPLEELGLLVADQIKLWRFQNQVAILNKAEAYLKKKGSGTRKVSLKVLTPLLEESSLEEEESLQNKWAALFANTVVENSQIDTTLYSHILSQMTKRDAELFEIVYNGSVTTQEGPKNSLIQVSITVKHDRVIIIKELRETFKDFDLILDNLIRLRLIKEMASTVEIDTTRVALTGLGFRFMSAITIH